MAAPHMDNTGVQSCDIGSISICCPSQWNDQGTTTGPGPGRGTGNGLAIGPVLGPAHGTKNVRKGSYREGTLPYIYMSSYHRCVSIYVRMTNHRPREHGFVHRCHFCKNGNVRFSEHNHAT